MQCRARSMLLCSVAGTMLYSLAMHIMFEIGDQDPGYRNRFSPWFLATYPLGIKQPMAVQPQPLLLPAETP